jgi:hypothetical protein
MPVPEHLEHKPVFSIPYRDFDGIHVGNTDARFLSIGLAQYDEDCVSAKTMRHIRGRWSRQAEELPLHRAVDLTLFIAETLFGSHNDHVTIPSGTFENQREDLPVAMNTNRSEDEIVRFRDFMDRHGPQLRRRLRALASVLDDLRGNGNL